MVDKLPIMHQTRSQPRHNRVAALINSAIKKMLQSERLHHTSWTCPNSSSMPLHAPCQGAVCAKAHDCCFGTNSGTVHSRTSACVPQPSRFMRSFLKRRHHFYGLVHVVSILNLVDMIARLRGPIDATSMFFCGFLHELLVKDPPP